MKISAIVTTHNRAELLPQAIESVLGQEPCDAEIEVIVVDDASTDNTPIVVASYPTVRYVTTRQGTVAGSRNVGIEHARGEWVAFLDDDDAWLPHKLKKCRSLMGTNPQAGFIYSAALLCDADLQRNGRIWEGPLMVDGEVPMDAFFDTLVSPSGVLMRRDVFSRVGLFDPTVFRSEDRDMWLRLVYSGVKCVGTDEPLVLYRLRDRIDGEVDYQAYAATITVLQRYLGKQNVHRPSWRRRRQVLRHTRGWYALRMLQAARQARRDGRQDLMVRFGRAAFRISPLHAAKGLLGRA